MKHFITSLKLSLFFCLVFIIPTQAQQIHWSDDGNSYYKVENNSIVRYDLPANTPTTLISADMLTPENGEPLAVWDFTFSPDKQKMLIYTNGKKVWRLPTQGDYWVLNLKTKKLQQVGKKFHASSLRFAKRSPDGSQVAYVSEYNIYVESLDDQQITAVTKDGNRKLIYGTFDWAYEEEFACRDGFQWNTDGSKIAYWQIDARKIPDYDMVNFTDSVYSEIIPVEYPTAGTDPSPAKIGVYNLKSNTTNWLNIPGDPQQHYLTRMEWNNPNLLFLQQLNRKQNESKIYKCDVEKNTATVINQEKNNSWIDVLSPWGNSYTLTFRHEFQWINDKKEFLWFSEKDGWRHMYRIGLDGKEQLITKGDYDVLELLYADDEKNEAYFLASPENATQKYLYKIKLDGKGKAERVTPGDMPGTHDYNISPNGKYAFHSFQNSYTKPAKELITLPQHKALDKDKSIAVRLSELQEPKTVEFFKVTIVDGTEMDGLMVKPKDFDASKKYPVVFYVYTEPWGATVNDTYSAGKNFLYNGDMAEDGYIYITIDNRGTPAPKGTEWRKSIYRKIGRLNISDQARAAEKVLEWDYVDPERVAVWGWSGGGSATLNLMFQYPEIYKTGIAVAAVANQLTYDNIYQERYMGLPQENKEEFVLGSPLTYAKNLEGNLLYIHGTGDDNVHYNNAEMLINELVKYGKQFQMMAYPNRTHGISEGEGTGEHLSTLYTNYLKMYCPPGGR